MNLKRSNIGIIKTNGEIETNSCHWDGYPQHNGCMLFNFYNSIEKVYELISKGDINRLNETIKESDFLGSRINTNYKSLEELIDDFKGNKGIEYVYLFSELEKKWYFYNNSYHMKELKDLKKEYRKQLKNSNEKIYDFWTKNYHEIIYDYGKIPESFIQLDDMHYADINSLHFVK